MDKVTSNSVLLGRASEEVLSFHNASDVDHDRGSQHHTLGTGPNQAAPGDHTHDSNIAVGSKDVTDLLIAGVANVVSAARITRRGQWVELYVSITCVTAFGANVLLVPLPAAHAPIMTYSKYIAGLNAGSGAPQGCYIDTSGFKMVFGTLAGSSHYAEFGYVAVP